MIDPIKAHIREDVGRWIITLDHGDLHYHRHAWTHLRAEEIARELEKLARETLEARK